MKLNGKYFVRQDTFIHMADQHWMYAKMRPLLKGGKLLKVAIVIQLETFLMTDTEPLRDYLDHEQNREKRFALDLFLNMDTAQSWLWE